MLAGRNIKVHTGYFHNLVTGCENHFSNKIRKHHGIFSYDKGKEYENMQRVKAELEGTGPFVPFRSPETCVSGKGWIEDSREITHPSNAPYDDLQLKVDDQGNKISDLRATEVSFQNF